MLKPESAVKMFQQVLNRLIEEKWKIVHQADAECTHYRKFISETSKYHHNKFSSYSFAQERVDKFLSELLDNQKEYEELWATLGILLTLSHGQAAVEWGFSVSMDVLAPNLQEMSLRALRHIHSSWSAKKIKVADFQISEELLSSCNHASNSYKMFLMEKKTEKEHTVRGKKKKAMMEELASAKKKKEELESVAKKLIDTANKKAKEAEKQKDASQMKALLIESNASIEKSKSCRKETCQLRRRQYSTCKNS